ncbi:MAG: ROK family protein [Planctomycetota bacterium]|nr:MAG: ROK family protein [Planctomycetota bacterium]
MTEFAAGTRTPAALGIEIGGTKLQSAVVAADGSVLLCRADRIDPAGGAEGIRSVLAAQIAGIVEDASENRLAIDAVGIGFGGPVNRDRGLVATSFHVGGWSNFPLAAWVAEQVRDRLGEVPVILENDSNAAALGEALVGAGRGARVVVYSNAGSGIGSGLVIHGRLYRGRADGEMELGHIRLTREGGILEETSAGWAIDRRVREAVAADPGGALAREAAATTMPASARLLPGVLAVGDATAQTILDEAAGHYAHGLSHVVHLINPDVIVLGGGVATIGEPWRASVERQLEPLIMAPLRPGPPVRLATLGEDVVPVGAALAALDAAIESSRSDAP